MAKKPSTSPESTPDEAVEAPAFEDAIAELETLVEQMEGGSLSLEESLLAYRRGADLVAHCRKALSSVQQQVRVLEGELLKPFDAGPDTGASS